MITLPDVFDADLLQVGMEECEDELGEVRYDLLQELEDLGDLDPFDDEERQRVIEIQAVLKVLDAEAGDDSREIYAEMKALQEAYNELPSGEHVYSENALGGLFT